MSELRPVEQILDLARWAPSGDNTQPWRFEIIADDHVVIHGFDTRHYCVYDLTGHPSQLAIGGLLETFCIAATGFSLRAKMERLDSPETHPVFDIKLTTDTGITPSPLIPHITRRAVQRRPMKTQPLSLAEKRKLESSVGVDYKIIWMEDWRMRLEVARLMFVSGKIRLTTPEAFDVHRRVIEWNACFSIDKIPDQAVGLDPLTTRLMRWVMQDWRRVEFFNTYLGGTLLPRVQLDFLPSLACAGHFLVVARTPPAGLDDYVSAGGAMQRFWLTATELDLHIQPEMTPLIFSMYAREGRRFSVRQESLALARKVRKGFEALIEGEMLAAGVFMGRIGVGPAAVTRSTRLSLDSLILR